MYSGGLGEKNFRRPYYFLFCFIFSIYSNPFILRLTILSQYMSSCRVLLHSNFSVFSFLFLKLELFRTLFPPFFEDNEIVARVPQNHVGKSVARFHNRIYPWHQRYEGEHSRLSKSRNTNAVTCAICYTIQPAIFLL